MVRSWIEVYFNYSDCGGLFNFKLAMERFAKFVFVLLFLTSLLRIGVVAVRPVRSTERERSHGIAGIHFGINVFYGNGCGSGRLVRKNN